jgi:hypothetical protein
MPLACDAHHLEHWADGGATSLDNLVLLEAVARIVDQREEPMPTEDLGWVAQAG